MTARNHNTEEPELDLKNSSVHAESPQEVVDSEKGTEHMHEAILALNDPDWKAKEKKLVRILDFTLLPMLWILYLFNYLDRTSIAQARLNTFEEDLGLEGNQFNTAVSVLTAG